MFLNIVLRVKNESCFFYMISFSNTCVAHLVLNIFALPMFYIRVSSAHVSFFVISDVFLFSFCTHIFDVYKRTLDIYICIYTSIDVYSCTPPSTHPPSMQTPSQRTSHTQDCCTANWSLSIDTEFLTSR